jgi:hypothetical protein
MSTRAWQVIAGILIILLFGIPISIFMAQHWELISDIFLVLFLCGALYLIGLMVLSLRGRFLNQDLIYTKDGRMPAHRLRDGSIEVLIDDHPIADHLTLSGTRERGLLPPPVEVKEETDELPKAPPFDEIAHLIGPGDRILLGFNGSGALFVHFIDLCSTVVLGKSRRGKTTFLMFILIQILTKRGEVHIWDGQGALTRSLRRMLPNCAYDTPTLRASVAHIKSITQKRLARWIDDETATFPPIVIIADEWDLLTSLCRDVVPLTSDIIKHAAKVNVHVVFSGQNLPADLIGGSKNRGGIVSRVIFYAEQEVATDVGLKSRKAKGLLDRLEFAPAGYAIIGTANLTWQIIAIPNTSHQHIHEAVRELDNFPALPPLPMRPKAKANSIEPDMVTLPARPSSAPGDEISPVEVESDEKGRKAKRHWRSEEALARTKAQLRDHPHSSGKDIAELLGVSESQGKNYRRRALEQL